MRSSAPNLPTLWVLLMAIATTVHAQDVLTQDVPAQDVPTQDVPAQKVPSDQPSANHGATLVPNPQISPVSTWVPRQTAILRLLDKVASRVTPLTVPVGATIQAGSLSITLTACDSRPSDLPRDATAHVKITDSSNAGNFDGWILANEPGLAVFEHPVYDIQLVGCA